MKFNNITEFHFDFTEEILKEKSNKGKNINKNKEENYSVPTIFEDKYPIRTNIIKTLLILEVILVIDQLLEGNDKFSSIIGIKK